MIEISKINHFFLTVAAVSEYRRLFRIRRQFRGPTLFPRDREDIMKRINLLRPAAFVVFLAAFAGLPAVGQTVTGTITGTVTDPSGAVVGANVTAQNTATGVQNTAESNGAGVYTIRFLPIGTYTVAVNAKGFTPA